MAFRFAARTLLELGKELISSDDVALYELIKNAVDARSQKVYIEAQVVITHSNYVRALERLDSGVATATVMDELRSSTLASAPKDANAAFVSSLERRVNDRSRFRTALVSAYARHNWIEVRDSGDGMSLEALDQVFLTVGTRSRRADNIEGAKYLGDKGVGRLSAMRLGDRLLVVSTTAGQSHWGRLRINWNLFSHDQEAQLEDIKIAPVRAAPKADVLQKGTVVRISALNADWTSARFDDVVKGRIARMVDPFSARGNDLIVTRHNGSRVLIPAVPDKLLKNAHAVCRIELEFDKDGQPKLTADLNYALRHKQRKVVFTGVEIFSMTQRSSKRRGKKGHAQFENVHIRPAALRDLGPFKADIYWFNRLIVKAIEDFTSNQQATREEISNWSGGPMLFRHGFRILPYGEPSDDWLALDTNAFSEAGFKLNRQQVMGRVLIDSTHLALSEQTNRQGLIESDAAIALRAMVQVILHVELRELIKEADAIETINSREAEEAALEFRVTQELVHRSLDDLRARLLPDQFPYADRLGAHVDLLVTQCAAAVRKLDDSVAKSVTDREKFIHLAGIGLMTEFIFHELDRAVRYTMSVLSTARGNQQASAMRSLEDQLITLQKRVSAFDDLSGERRQVKAQFDVGAIVSDIVESHSNQFSRHNIDVELRAPPGLNVRAVKGMLVQILENLISNSVYWLKLQKEYEPGFEPSISVSVDPSGRFVSIEDNGPGVDPSRREAIFQPFITSKPPGQGRGLGLYISRELAEYNGWKLYMNETVGLVRAGRLNTFVVDMGGT